MYRTDATMNDRESVQARNIDSLPRRLDLIKGTNGQDAEKTSIPNIQYKAKKKILP